MAQPHRQGDPDQMPSAAACPKAVAVWQAKKAAFQGGELIERQTAPQTDASLRRNDLLCPLTQVQPALTRHFRPTPGRHQNPAMAAAPCGGTS